MRDPFADRPDLAEIVEQIRELAARAPDLVVSVALREPRKSGRHASGTGYISRKVSRGYVTYKPRVIVDGVVHWGDGVGVKVGVREAEAKAQAQQNLRKLLADIAQDKVVPTEVRQLTVGEVLTKWLAAIDGSDRSPNTKAKYRLHVERDVEPRLGSVLLRRLTPEHREQLHAKMREAGHASSTIRDADLVFTAALRWAKQKRRLPVPELVLEGVEKPGHTPKERRSVSVAEALTLIEAMKDEHPFGPLVATLYYGGLRDGEASALKWGDIGLDGFELKRQRDRHTRAELAPKWRSHGWVPLLPQLREILDAHRAWCEANGYPTGPDDWVFGHRRGKSSPIRPPLNFTTWTHIKNACKRAKLSDDISAHSLRHGFADAADEAGVSVRDLADILRNDPVVTLRYQHRNRRKMREAAERISAVMAPPKQAAPAQER